MTAEKPYCGLPGKQAFTIRHQSCDEDNVLSHVCLSFCLSTGGSHMIIIYDALGTPYRDIPWL